MSYLTDLQRKNLQQIKEEWKEWGKRCRINEESNHTLFRSKPMPYEIEEPRSCRLRRKLPSFNEISNGAKEIKMETNAEEIKHQDENI